MMERFFSLCILILSPLATFAEVAPYQLMPQACPASFAVRGQLTVDAKLLKQSSLTFALHYVGSQPYLKLHLGSGKATVHRVVEKKEILLAEETLGELSGALPLRLFRNSWNVELTIGGRRIISAIETTLTGGKVGLQSSGKAFQFGSISLQPLAPIYFSDDFTRGEGETGEWDILAGGFDVHEIEAHSKKAKKGGVYSANAFRWQSSPSDSNLAAAGRWNWKSYHYAVSVRPTKSGVTGLCVLFQDEDNYVAFECDAGATGECRLMEMRGGKLSLLARSERRLEPGQWYRLDVVTLGNHLDARIDGQRVCSTVYNGWQCGRVGIFSENAAAQFDDAQVRSTDGLHASHLPAESKTLFPFGQASVAEIGDASWSNATCELAGEKMKNAAILYGVRELTYGVMQISSSKAEFFRVKQGEPAISLGKVNLPKYERVGLSLDGHTVTAIVDGKPMIAVYDPGETSGRMAIAWERKRIPFERVDAVLPLNLYPPDQVTDQFTREKTMLDWATPSSVWMPLDSGEYQYEGGLFGDVDVELTNTQHISASDRWTLRLTDPLGRSSATMVATPGGNLTLSVDGKQIGSIRLTAKQASQENLVFVKRDSTLELRLGAATLLHGPVTNGNLWNRIRFTPTQTKLSPSYFDVRSPRTTDITFSGAPVRWWAERGDWDVHPRWPCDDRWSFLGGLNSESPVLWSKERYDGDMVVDAWIALYMDNVGEASVGYKHISDLNVSICGDGRNLDSGYSFLFGAKGNTVTQIRKGSTVVAETPLLRMIAPRRMHIGWQRHWYHLHMVRSGQRLTLAVDGVPALQYDDPAPIKGGHVALWTWSGGLMVARTRIGAQDVSLPLRPLPSAPLARINAPAWTIQQKPLAAVADFDQGIGTWAALDDETDVGQVTDGTKSVFRAVNRRAGGAFGIKSGIAPFDAVQFPKLALDFLADANVKVNLVAAVNGVKVCIPATTGDAEADQTVLKSLGVSANGKWQTVEYDLLSALKAKMPAAASYRVQSIEFSAPAIDYLRSGMGGNPFGASYSLDNFKVMAAEGVPATAASAIPAD